MDAWFIDSVSEFMRRLSPIEAQLPRIPVQSISMDDADQLIR